jgi:aminoglycoside phosphotransferase (APT) family kinase protein
MMTQAKLQRILQAFSSQLEIEEWAPLPGGLIHGSWVITTQDDQSFVFQRMNTEVFARPAAVMDNIRLVTAHLRAAGETTLDFLPLAADPASDLYHSEEEETWRLCRFVTGSRPAGLLQGPDDAHAAGQAFGRFTARLAGFPADQLAETLPGFHDTPLRWAALLQAHHQDEAGRAEEVALEMEYLFEKWDLSQGLFRLDLPVRVAHNDAKWANVLLDAETGKPRCAVDLDTVMPGTPLHDFGDLMRTVCCSADEEETDLDRVEVDPSLVEALAEGWVTEMDAVLEPIERLNLLPAGLVITFEQVIRYLTDYLQGDVYYRTEHSQHNLDRARNQLALLESMLNQLPELARVLP